jgi:hypothetical protein
MANSRMKDYFDLFVILRNAQLDQGILADAVSATLNRRGTVKPKGYPLGLSEQFATDTQKLNQWNAFVTRNKLTAESLSSTVQYLRNSLSFLFQD